MKVAQNIDVDGVTIIINKVYNVNVGDTLTVGEDGLFGYTVNWDIFTNP